ncbi:MAG: FlgD immunoglobulin-like domain containing protein [Candidatus Coatesbacteria bacterium]
MPRAALHLCLGLFLASPAAAARWDLTATFPWSYSVNGTEAATALGIGYLDSIWVAGNVTNAVGPTTGRDVLALYYSRTQTLVSWTAANPARPLMAVGYDRAGMDEGPPALAVHNHGFGSGDTEPEEYLVFTSTGEGLGELTTFRLRGPFLPVGGSGSSSPWHENQRGYPCGGAGVAVDGSGTPFSVGWVTANGVDQLFVVRQIRKNVGGTDSGPRVSATFWTGSLTLSVTGRAIAVDGIGNAWIAAQSGGDIVLFKYTPACYEDTFAGELFASPEPGWPRRFATAAWDEPLAGVRDVMGDFWVAGSMDADGAVWQFDENGNPAPGFPVRYSPGPATVFRGIVMDAARNCYVTGSVGNDTVVMGWDHAGAPLPGLPFFLPAGVDGAAGAGIVLDSTGAIWVAATVTAAPATWGGTRIALYRYAFVPDPPPVALGEVKIRGPEGAVLNLARGERMTILAWPPGGGSVVVRIRNLRGELIRELEDTGPGHQVVTLEWDGANAAGQPVASGAYACFVTGGGLSVMKRLVVVRRP